MKKALKFIVKLLLGLILLPVVVLLIFWTKNLLFIGGIDDKNTDYLAKNKQIINKQAITNQPDTEIFDNEFYQNQVFLLGENHGFADVQILDKYMLKHLNKKVALRYYLAEMDSIRSNKLNTFLLKEDKDTLLLKQVIRDIKLRIPQQSSKELYQKWSDIYDYNKQLPDSLKIIVLGLDKNFDDESQAGRDSIMFENFMKIIESKNLQKEKFYGYFGFTHVLQNGYGEKNILPLAARIKRSNLPFAKKIQSMVCYNLESEMYMPKNNQYPSPSDEKVSIVNLNGPIVMAKGIKDLEEVTHPNTITLFDLDNTHSPYRNNQKLAGIKVNLFGDDILPNQAEQKTTDFFQYVFLIRNSKALTKLD